MARLQKAVVVLLIVAIILSIISIAFNIVIFNITSSDSSVIGGDSPNAGNIGLIVERNNEDLGRPNG